MVGLWCCCYWVVVWSSSSGEGGARWQCWVSLQARWCRERARGAARGAGRRGLHSRQPTNGPIT